MRQRRQATLSKGTIFGSYEVIELLGAGGMAMVYRACRQLGREEVALKVLLPNLASKDVLRQRFRTEAHVQFELVHPHIVRVHDLVDSADMIGFVMELIMGPTLEHVISEERPGPWTFPEAFEVLEPVLEALAYAHARSVVHRDIKPSNILLDRSAGPGPGIPKVTDFGLAKLLAGDQGMTMTGTMMGTLPYMSPEQFEGAKNATQTADVYALGMMLWRMLGGRLPIDASKTTAVYGLYTGQVPPPRLAELASGVEEPVEREIGRALSLDPGQRHADAGELLMALRALTASAPAPPPSMPPPEDPQVEPASVPGDDLAAAAESAVAEASVASTVAEASVESAVDEAPAESAVGEGPELPKDADLPEVPAKPDRPKQGSRWVLAAMLLLLGGAGAVLAAVVGGDAEPSTPASKARASVDAAPTQHAPADTGQAPTPDASTRNADAFRSGSSGGAEVVASPGDAGTAAQPSEPAAARSAGDTPGDASPAAQPSDTAPVSAGGASDGGELKDCPAWQPGARWVYRRTRGAWEEANDESDPFDYYQVRNISERTLDEEGRVVVTIEDRGGPDGVPVRRRRYRIDGPCVVRIPDSDRVEPYRVGCISDNARIRRTVNSMAWSYHILLNDERDTETWLDPDIGYVRIAWTERDRPHEVELVGYEVGGRSEGKHRIEPVRCAWTRRAKLSTKNPERTIRLSGRFGLASISASSDEVSGKATIELTAGDPIEFTEPHLRLATVHSFVSQDDDGEYVFLHFGSERQHLVHAVAGLSDGSVKKERYYLPTRRRDKVAVRMRQRRNTCFVQLQHRKSARSCTVANLNLTPSGLQRASGSLRIE